MALGRLAGIVWVCGALSAVAAGQAPEAAICECVEGGALRLAPGLLAGVIRPHGVGFDVLAGEVHGLHLAGHIQRRLVEPVR